MSRRNVRVFRYGRESGEVLLNNGAHRSWRLETREDSNDRGMFVMSEPVSARRVRARHIGHYMFAGGMRQHASAHIYSLPARRRRLAVMLMLAMLAAWFVLRWMPLD